MHLANACLDAESSIAHRKLKLAELLLAADTFGEEEVDEALERAERGEVGSVAGELLAALELALLT